MKKKRKLSLNLFNKLMAHPFWSASQVKTMIFVKSESVIAETALL